MSNIHNSTWTECQDHSVSGAYRAEKPGFLARVAYSLAIYRQRRALSKLDSHLLNDIGMSELEAYRESSRPLWDVPNTWRR